MEKHKKIVLTNDWILKKKGENKAYPASVPGSVYETLLVNGVISDPFYGMNEFDSKWVYESDWEYSTTLFADEELLNSEVVFLRFKGLDTICKVYFNEEEILNSENMHRIYDCYLKNREKNILKRNNLIRVLFKSPVREAYEIVRNMGFDINNIGAHDFQIPGVETLRKAYHSFGWDWGPKIPDMGIWRDVELHTFTDTMIDDLTINTDIEFSKPGKAEKAIVKTQLTLNSHREIDAGDDYSVRYVIGNKEETVCDVVKMVKGNLISNDIKLNDPELWWTKEFGTPALYQISVFLLCGTTIVDEKTLEFGIREVNLIRNKDKWGETFYFELNKIPIFAKGGNWIPSDSLIVRGRRKKLYEKVIRDCVDANMNMIRVWGGGVYEDDEFYDYCDHKGILVWQDFTFACRPTPDFQGFEENIKLEAIDNIKRLRNHPSLAIWVGNNEMEEGWVYWGFDKVVPGLKTFYLKLFEDILPSCVSEFDGNRPYWPSSPSSGGKFLNPDSADYGDSHYWEVWHDGYPLESYREFDSRFMSEFGFESFPDIKTVKTFCPEDQMVYNSEIMENHQKNSAGNQKIYDYMEKQFSIPKEFEKQIILSQLSQAEAMQYGVEHWRRNRNDYHCMGALYWQINDCWPVASWSSIDYYGRWKALHYVAKRFFNPLMISGCETEKDMEVWISNDYNEAFEGTYEIEVVSTGGEVLYTTSETVKVEKLSSEMVKKITLEEIKSSAEDCIVFFKLLNERTETVSEGFKLFCVPKKLSLEKPVYDCKLDQNGSSYSLTLSSSVPVVYCSVAFQDRLDDEIIITNDNYFSLGSGKKVIQFNSDKEITLNDLIIRSLFEITR